MLEFHFNNAETKHELTIAYSLLSNGVVEKVKRDLVRLGRLM